MNILLKNKKMKLGGEVKRLDQHDNKINWDSIERE